MADSPYHLVVIGGGPGGYVAAIRAAQLGFRTALVEKNANLGGTCLNVGCIPSKALLAASEHYHFAQQELASYGVQVQGVTLDLATMMARKNKVVNQLAKGVEFLLKKNKIDLIRGEAFFTAPGKISVRTADGSESPVETDRILIASGSTPVALPFLPFDGQAVVSSDQGISFDQVPESLIVIGGGAIGLELGSVWNRLGSKVTVVEFLPKIAAFCDEEISTHLQRSLEKQGITFLTETKVVSGSVEGGRIRLSVDRGETTTELEAEKVLVAVGRRPNTASLGIEKSGLQLTDKGRIAVDHHWKTSVSSVYAIGDVVDGPMLAHKAEDEGVAVVERMVGKPGHVNYAVCPSVVYTAPEAASCGLTEEQARSGGIEYKKGFYRFFSHGRALASGMNEGFVKILADAKTDRVIGCHIVSSVASELIATCVLLMEFGGSSEDLARTIHAHPTMSEALKEAALAVDGRSIHS